MELTSPVTLALAWVVVPLAVLTASSGLGFGVQLLTGMRLGALMLPTGFLAGIAITQLALGLGLRGAPAVALVVLASAAGFLAGAVRARAEVTGFAGARSWLRSHRGAIASGAHARVHRSHEGPILEASSRERRARPWEGVVWPALCAVAAFAVGMAPLVGSGRAGILGYVLSNDSSVHIATVELLREHGATVLTSPDSSYQAMSQLLGGYPIGSLAWPLFAGVALGVDAFYIWSPLIALSAAMTALVAYDILRRASAPAALAAIGGATVASGYLPFSYLAQGNAKEVMVCTAIYGSVALFTVALERGITPRRVLPIAIAVAAGIAIYGVGVLAFLAPAAAVGSVVAVARARGRSRLTVTGALVAGAAVALVLSAPFLASALRFLSVSGMTVNNPAAYGNLLGPVPLREALNVWVSGDYRVNVPDHRIVTNVGSALAALAAVTGLAGTLASRRFGVGLSVLAGAAGALLVSRSASIYFDAKTYVVLAVALGLATAAGITLLWRVRRARWLGAALGVVLVLLVAASDVAVYRQIWMTPEARFEELIALGERYSGQGPTLVNEREDYARYFLRGAKPWETWGPWYVQRGLRSGEIPPPPPHTPDFDDYHLEFFTRFRLLVERKRPGGSLPPSGFRAVDETSHYRVWRRDGKLPRAHIPLGPGTVNGTAKLDCGAPQVRALLRTARAERLPVRYATQGPRVVVSRPNAWLYHGAAAVGPQAEYITRSGGVAIAQPPLRPGRYEAWIQGMFGSGVRLHVLGQSVGDVFSDLGQHDQWHRVGTFAIKRPKPLVTLMGLSKPWWQAGSTRGDVTGPIAYVPTASRRGVGEMPAESAASLCGRRLDWVELP